MGHILLPLMVSYSLPLLHSYPIFHIKPILLASAACCSGLDVWRVVDDYYGQAVGKLQAESMMSTAASLFPQ
jgi:hypothetical protein